MKEVHCPLPQGSGAVYCRSCTAHCPQAVGQCVHCRTSTAHCPLPTTTVQQGTHSAVWCRAPSRVHHTEGTGGAARHTGCSGQMRPCVTARRRRQGSVGQVRECTGPAMPQHTYTQRAHTTHSPARLPVPVGRHPGLCLLVTAPSAHHTTPHHTTPHHTTPHHTTPHHTTPHHTLSTPQLYPWAGCRVQSPRRQGPGTTQTGGVLTVSGLRVRQRQAPPPREPAAP